MNRSAHASETGVSANLELLDRLASTIAEHRLTDMVCNGALHCFGQSQDSSDLKPIESQFESDSVMRTELAQLALSRGVALNLANPIAEIVTAHRIVGRLRIHLILGSGVSEVPLLSVRRHPEAVVELRHLQQLGFLDSDQLQLLQQMLVERANFLIAGRTGSGKTTLLGALLIALGGRTILIEEIPEILLPPPAATLTQRLANTEGRGAIGIQRLLIESLRMRPDRVVVGEVRGTELATLLQALNNGHRGSGATIHAASPELVVQRLILLGMLAGLTPELTARLVAGGIDYLLQLDVTAAGRRLVAITKPMLRGDSLQLVPVGSNSLEAAL